MFVKICGITSEDDALLAVALGASAVGFVFAPSPRQVAPGMVADIVKRLPPSIVTVGVFRDEAPQRVSDVAHSCGLSAVQLHGHEPPESARWLRTRLPMVIQAFPAGDSRIRRSEEYGVDAVLVDGSHPGSGTVFDWALAADVPASQRVIIAGGLDPANVRAAITGTRCWGVDVSTGVERSPGDKDPIKLRAFISEALAAFDAMDAERRGPEADGEASSELYDWQEET